MSKEEIKVKKSGIVKVTGSKANDIAELSKVGDNTYKLVMNDKTMLLSGDELKKVKFDLKGGDDQLIIDASVDIPVEIHMGKGDDVVINSADKAQIATGKGDDLVVNDADDVKIRTKRGKDVVASLGDGNDISLGKGHDKALVKGNKNKVKGRRGPDAILVWGNDNKARGGRGRDILAEIGFNNDLKGGKNKDVVLEKVEKSRNGMAQIEPPPFHHC